MEKTEQLKSILTDLDNRELTKHQAHDLICVLFSVSKSVNCEHIREGILIKNDVPYAVCRKCGELY
jgi:hypothetical protein